MCGCHDGSVVAAVNVKTLDEVRRAAVDIRQAVLRILMQRAADAAQIFADRAVASDLARQATLEAHPLPVDVVIAFELGAVPLNARDGLNLDDLLGH